MSQTEDCFVLILGIQDDSTSSEVEQIQCKSMWARHKQAN